MARTPKQPKQVETLTHGGRRARNIPTAEIEPVLDPADREPARVANDRISRLYGPLSGNGSRLFLEKRPAMLSMCRPALPV